MLEYAAGPDQVIVVYDTAGDEGTRRKGLSRGFVASIAADAADRAARGFAMRATQRVAGALENDQRR